MKRTGAEVETAFKRQRRVDIVADLKRAWWLIALLIASFGFAIVNGSMPRRSLGVEEGVVINIGLRETEAGSFLYVVVRLSDGSDATIAVPRSEVLRDGATVRVEAFERAWPWRRRTHRYVAQVQNEH